MMLSRKIASSLFCGAVAFTMAVASAQTYHPTAYQYQYHQHPSGGHVTTTGSQPDIIDPSNFNEAVLCRLIHDLTNQERASRGLPPLAPHSGASAAAAHHSRDMARRGYFDHKSKGILRSTSPQQRMASYGFQPRRSAENIAMIPTYNSQLIQTRSGGGKHATAIDPNGYTRLAQYAMQEWMRSPGHRKNILNPQLATMGVGAAVGTKNNVPYVYLTQNFGG